MKAEDRILEIMAEYLRKTDQLLERMKKTDEQADRTNRSVEMMARAIAENDIKFNQTNEKFNVMNEKFNLQFAKVNDNIKSLREDQGIMLKELVSQVRICWLTSVLVYSVANLRKNC